MAEHSNLRSIFGIVAAIAVLVAIANAVPSTIKYLNRNDPRDLLVEVRFPMVKSDDLIHYDEVCDFAGVRAQLEFGHGKVVTQARSDFGISAANFDECSAVYRFDEVPQARRFRLTLKGPAGDKFQSTLAPKWPRWNDYDEYDAPEVVAHIDRAAWVNESKRVEAKWAAKEETYWDNYEPPSDTSTHDPNDGVIDHEDACNGLGIAAEQNAGTAAGEGLSQFYDEHCP